jgi:ethanolamine ammonia-lyase small subunit
VPEDRPKDGPEDSPEVRSAPALTRTPWEGLRRFTAARLALARARDAVHRPLDTPALFADLRGLGLEVAELSSRAGNRQAYLLRPDLGRRLDPESATRVRGLGLAPPDLALVVSDGLSSAAVQRQAVPFLAAFLPLARSAGRTLSPVLFVHRGRVAVGDELGELLTARAVAVLIGERPGLSAPDSLGAYLTWGPRIGLTDERRNCISNIRPAGLSFDRAARTLDWLLSQALARGLSGVGLKDEQTAPGGPAGLTGP